MRNLSLNEIQLVNGGLQSNLEEAFTVASIFAIGCGTFGSIFSAVVYYETLPTAAVQTILANALQANLVTLPIAMFAGLGIGGLVGATLGFGLYYSGIITKAE
ncbi:hypothetical protein [Candidatus Berkiella aquae]|nr:hypothetical protein [Candidatus Berkiella aquae]MCS5710844.1 hypothetical protein [Candidatus Berkiella aquae]